MATTAKVDILEERMKNLIKTNSDAHQLIMEQIECLNEKLDKAFVTRLEFDPVRRVAYGLVAGLASITIVILTIAIKFALER